MPWSLEICHIGLNNNGDSTLIVARDDTPPGRIRTMLIDGGQFNQAVDMVHPFIAARHAPVDVMVVTHYDEDHMDGIRGLLEIDSPLYNDVLLFDQGEPGVIHKFSQGPYDEKFDHTPRGREDSYTKYIDIPKKNRIRITASVASDNKPANNNNWRNENWLLRKEIFWAEALRFDKNKNYDPDGKYGRDGVILPQAQWDGGSWNANGDPINLDGNVLIPAGAPSIRCIACNQYVQGQAGLVGGVGGSPETLKNRKSIILLLQFNNFKYYIGGDAETDQEDAATPILNPAANFDYGGRVHAVKLSHHGASSASSENFINRLKPKAAFISNGPRNKFGHPHQAVINRLESISVHNDIDNGLVNYFLSGQSGEPENNNRPAAADTNPDIAEVPSFPPPFFDEKGYTGGRHTIITVTEAQSNANANGIDVHNFNVKWKDCDEITGNPISQDRTF